MSKTPADIPTGKSDKKKRKKHFCLQHRKPAGETEQQCKHPKRYRIGMTTIYNLKKQKDLPLKFYAKSDEQKLMKN